MKEIKIKRWPENEHLNEIYQPTKMIFAFVSSKKDGYRQCHEFVKCRDFLHDAVRASLQKKSCEIYGFKYDPEKNPPVDTAKTRMLVSKYNVLHHADKASDKLLNELKEFMTRGRDILNYYEKLAGLKRRTILHKASVGDENEDGSLWLFEGPGMWMRSSYLVSMFSFLIRLGAKNVSVENIDNDFKKLMNEKDNYDNDVNYLKFCANKLVTVMKGRKELFWNKPILKNYPNDVSISSFHNFGGIVSLCREKLPIRPTGGINEAKKKLTKMCHKG